MYLCKGILIFKLFKIFFMYGCADLPCFRGLSLVSASWGLCVTLSGLLSGGLLLLQSMSSGTHGLSSFSSQAPEHV